MLNLIAYTDDKYNLFRAARSLKEILKKPLMPTVVGSLKNTLKQEIIEVLWYCAQNLSYPEFYDAWNNPPITPHDD